MSKTCQNYCLDPLNFPKPILNRPGLSQIQYRIGAYADFREALLRKLNGDILLQSWTHRESDDPGIALLEGASILGDILTFYQELYANEAFLRTARWRESVVDLVRLLGYRLSPGVGGKATFAFEVKGNKAVTIPASFPVKAQLEKLEKPADFETTQKLTAYPWLSKFNLYRPIYIPNISNSTTEFFIEAPDPYLNPVDIKEEDRLLIGQVVGTGTKKRLVSAEIVIVDSIRTLHRITLYKIKGSLTKFSQSKEHLVAYKIGRSFQHFGHQAPLKYVFQSNNKTKECKQLFSRRLDGDTVSLAFPKTDAIGVRGARVLSGPIGKNMFPLDTSVEDLASGNSLIIEGLFYEPCKKTNQCKTINVSFIRKIKAIQNMSMTWGSISGSTTSLELDDDLVTQIGNVKYTIADIRKMQFHEVLEGPFTIRSCPENTKAFLGKWLNFYGTHAQAKTLKGRSLVLQVTAGLSAKAKVVQVFRMPGFLDNRPFIRPIKLDKKVPYFLFPNQKPIITVYGNLVEGDQGKTEKEAILGNGDARQKFQTFKLPKAPLTYHTTAGETPPDVPELDVYVNQIKWKRVTSFFGQGSKDQIYIVQEDEKEDSWIQFGDGKTGARLPTGSKNVVAKYRTGIGAYGPVKADTKPQAGGKVDNLDKIHLIGSASGGDQKESGDNAKEAAPSKVQSLGRLVSLKDFESEALGIAGVSRVRAAWQIKDNIPSVVLTVLMETGRGGEISKVQKTINQYNICRGPQRFSVVVVKGSLQYVYVDLVFGIHPRYQIPNVKKAIVEALGVSTGKKEDDPSTGLFALRQRQFGQPAYATQIEGVVQNVQGVEWVRVRGLGAFALTSAGPSQLQLPGDPKPNNKVIVCDPNHILSLYSAHLQLNSVVVQSKGDC